MLNTAIIISGKVKNIEFVSVHTFEITTFPDAVDTNLKSIVRKKEFLVTGGFMVTDGYYGSLHKVVDLVYFSL